LPILSITSLDPNAYPLVVMVPLTLSESPFDSRNEPFIRHYVRFDHNRQLGRNSRCNAGLSCLSGSASIKITSSW
jgi:hypothetical protein